MPPPPSTPAGGFKRQVVFRISAHDWPLLEQAAHKHGSIQAAILAGLHALTPGQPTPPTHTSPARDDTPPVATTSDTDPADQELTAREAARILGLKPDTVSSYIRSGRLPGHFNETWGSRGWVTNQAAVLAYQERIRASS